MTETFVPIMNRGWHLHASSQFIGHPRPRPERPEERAIYELLNNKLVALAYQLYDFKWLFDSYATGSESYLITHCGHRLILTRETGIVGFGGDYEYCLPNFQQPKVLVHDTIARIHAAPESLAQPEPDLLYIKFTGINLQNPHSGVFHFYDPIMRERRNLNLPQFVTYLETHLNPTVEPLITAALAGKKLDYREDEAYLRMYVAKAMLLATLFAPHGITFDRILKIVTHFDSFERTWQYLTLAAADGSLHLHDGILYDLYPPQTLYQVRYEKPRHIDY